METLRKQCGREGVPAYMIEKGQSVPNPDSDFSNLFWILFFQKKIRRRERQRWGGHAEFSRIVSRKVVEKHFKKIEKDLRKLWMICVYFHLCFFSWFECRDYLCRDRALEAVSAKNDSSPRRRMKTFHFAKSFTVVLEFLISCQISY